MARRTWPAAPGRHSSFRHRGIGSLRQARTRLTLSEPRCGNTKSMSPSWRCGKKSARKRCSSSARDWDSIRRVCCATSRDSGLLTWMDLVRHEDLSALDDDGAVWIEWHLIAFVGTYFLSKYGGEWIVDNDPESPTLSRYLVATGDPTLERQKIDPAARCTHSCAHRSDEV